MFNPFPTRTHRFCLLGDRNASVAPAINEKEKLKACGLGERKITFENNKGSHQFLTEVLEDTFPLLKKTGVIVFVVRLEVSVFKLFPPGKNGYSIPYLRDESTLRQAVAYIRPLQKSIDIPGVCAMFLTLIILTAVLLMA